MNGFQTIEQATDCIVDFFPYPMTNIYLILCKFVAKSQVHLLDPQATSYQRMIAAHAAAQPQALEATGLRVS